MRSLLVFSVLIGFAIGQGVFTQFVSEFGKQYSGKRDFTARREIFLKNYQDMVEHNARYEAGEVTWARKVTKFYDMTHDEFVSAVGIAKPKYDNTTKVGNTEDAAYMEKLNKMDGAAPDHWSWVDEGGVTSVKNQGHCGSCAAFATMAVIETCFWQETGTLYDDLSEQHIVDCAYGHTYYDNEGGWRADGCDGAWPQAYFDWLITENGGMTEKESRYPYTGKNGHCKGSDSGNYHHAKLTGMHNKWDTDEADMKRKVYMNPVATDIISDYLGDYSHGVYDDSRCCDQDTDSHCNWNNNHEITVVGYGTEHGVDYWLVKNSWGDWFGEDGFFKIKRGTGHCGIGTSHQLSAVCEAI